MFTKLAWSGNVAGWRFPHPLFRFECVEFVFPIFEFVLNRKSLRLAFDLNGVDNDFQVRKKTAAAAATAATEATSTRLIDFCTYNWFTAHWLFDAAETQIKWITAKTCFSFAVCAIASVHNVHVLRNCEIRRAADERICCVRSECSIIAFDWSRWNGWHLACDAVHSDSQLNHIFRAQSSRTQTQQIVNATHSEQWACERPAKITFSRLIMCSRFSNDFLFCSMFRAQSVHSAHTVKTSLIENSALAHTFCCSVAKMRSSA